jgi:hypothetical protein
MDEPLVISLESIPGDAFEEPCVEIHPRQGAGDVLVASIEVLSLSNKRQGDGGRIMYLAKQQEILASPVHFIEIDLLREGTYATAVSRDLIVAKAGAVDYHVSVNRFDRLTDFFVYPILLQQKLPTIAVPLLPGHPDVPLDLPEAFDQAYDGGPYARVIRCGDDPILLLLRPAQGEWVNRAFKAFLTA